MEPDSTLKREPYYLGFGVPYFNTFFLKETLMKQKFILFSPWLLKSPVKREPYYSTHGLGSIARKPKPDNTLHGALNPNTLQGTPSIP